MSKIDPTTLDHLIIRRTLHNAAGQIDSRRSEFTATWHDSATNKKVDFTGTIDEGISLKSARIQGSAKVYELNAILSDAELKGFNYLVTVELMGRTPLRSAA